MATLNAWYPPGSASASSVIANQGLPAVTANAWPVKITDGTDIALVNASGELQVTASALPLPVGAATEAKQDIGNASLASIDGKVATETTLASIDSKVATETTLAAFSAKSAGALVPAAFDYIALTYTGANVTTAVYKTGGSGGSTVATLTLAYTGSQLDSVTKT